MIWWRDLSIWPKSGQHVVERFLSNADAGFLELARQSKMGSPLKLAHPGLAHIRKWPIEGFNNHSVLLA